MAKKARRLKRTNLKANKLSSFSFEFIYFKLINIHFQGENGASFTGLEPILKDKIINTTEKVFDLDEKLNFLKENINQCTTNPSAPKVPVFKTCESLLDELPYAVSGMYVIHPNDQIEPFRVYCEVTESGSKFIK